MFFVVFLVEYRRTDFFLVALLANKVNQIAARKSNLGIAAKLIELV